MRHAQARYYHDESGNFADCYTVVFSHGSKLTPFDTSYPYATMSEHPTAPDGVWQHGFTHNVPVDVYKGVPCTWLGRRVTWSHLPQAIRAALEQEANQ